MNAPAASAALEVAVKDWRRHGGPRLRVSFFVLDIPGASHLAELGIERDWKGAAIVPDPPASRWDRWRAWFLPPRAVVFIFAGNCQDAADVARVAWHELAHVAGLDETEANELGFPSWT